MRLATLFPIALSLFANTSYAQTHNDCRDYNPDKYYILHYDDHYFQAEQLERLFSGSTRNEFLYYCYRVWVPAGQIGVFTLTPHGGEANFDLFLSTGWSPNTTSKHAYAPSGTMLAALTSPTSREHTFLAPSASGRWVYATVRNSNGATDTIVPFPRLGSVALKYRQINPLPHLLSAFLEVGGQALAEHTAQELYRGLTGQEVDRDTRTVIAMGVGAAIDQFQGADLGTMSSNALINGITTYYGSQFSAGSFGFSVATSATRRIIADIYSTASAPPPSAMAAKPRPHVWTDPPEASAAIPPLGGEAPADGVIPPLDLPPRSGSRPPPPKDAQPIGNPRYY